ncbi:GAF domain-containing sensor histidine kinase [Thermomonospora cellulosilytica]|uniref:histidine kinase n=1 Tax=Thermomonospora cellulosilytica TaxID=1411118 RepID=A0A7W3MZ26_9ACTN|nr:ATP-binding protein [Thermomonospora cellulosilytica]MBA9004462.1 signal transduction histidine kinase [Thermomonospora cellulosilytica]
MNALELLAGRGADLLVRIVTVACSDRVLPDMAAELAGLVVRSATDVPFCDVYVLDEEERALECPGRRPVPLGEGDVGWAAARGTARPHADGRGAALPVRAGRSVIAVVDIRSAGPCRDDDLELVTALADLFAPVLHSCRRLRNAQEREHSAERFAERAVEVQEAERARLVRDIHDGIAQRLASLGFHLSACDQALACGAVDEAHDQLVLARELCELAAAETRAAIGGLRPPVLDDLGLTAALATLAREAGSRRPELDVTVTVSGELEDALPDHVQTALYRIAQEAVANCLRHARATGVHLLLEHDADRVRLRVSDDGAGFSIQDVFAPGRRPDSYGLRGMAERAELLGGRVHVSSRPGGGTTVEALVPLRR